MKIEFTKRSVPLEAIEEQPLKKRKWDRYIYIGILVLIVASFLKWLMTPWIFISAQGILLQQQYDVQFPNDIRVLRYFVEEEQEIEVGDTLFSYQELRTGLLDTSVQDSIKYMLDLENKKQGLIALESQIEKRRLFLIELEKRLNYWKSEREKKVNLVYLGAITSNELANVDRWIDDISHEIAQTRSEYQVLIDEKRKIQASNENSMFWNQKNLGFNHEIPVFTSPMKGKIDRYRIREQQICYRQNIVVSLIYPDYFVRAFIEVKDLDKFNLKDQVDVVLPYGEQILRGTINKIYSISELKDDIVIDNLSVNQRKHGIVVEVTPSDSLGWNKLTTSNIPIRIRKKRIII